jgi:hypothetical protein
MLRAIMLLAVMTLTSGCLLVPAGPPVVAEPAVVVPAPVIIAPRPGYRVYRGYHGGYWHGHGYGHGRRW